MKLEQHCLQVFYLKKSQEQRQQCGRGKVVKCQGLEFKVLVSKHVLEST